MAANCGPLPVTRCNIIIAEHAPSCASSIIGMCFLLRVELVRIDRSQQHLSSLGFWILMYCRTILSRPSSNKLLRRTFVATNALTKKKVVILGCGWGGFRLAKDLDKSKYNVTVVSPRNHFLFTPLLPSTAVGTLEFRCIQEPVRTIPGVEYV